MPQKLQRRGPVQIGRRDILPEEVAFLTGQPRPEGADPVRWYALTYESGLKPSETPSALWRAAGEAILRAWVARRPGRRPHGWWLVEAPEPRRRVGGADLPSLSWDPERADGRRGPRWRRTLGIPRAWAQFASGVIQFEGEAAYLDRLGLWMDGERDRAPKTAWDPVDVGVQR
ncbi:MAG: hypothetical protein EA417_00900 [Gammaproteobacteria bacterium]|nr:MAG: hypothetical protein EA417_00900 [Gammaproteobacteria bacterium]